MVVTWTLTGLTRSTLSYAALFGIRDDLNLVGTQYSTLSSIFYVGWLLWALPGNLLMAKFPLSKYLGLNVSCPYDTSTHR